MQQPESFEPRLMKFAAAAPYLERGEEKALARRWKGGQDQAALHRLIEAHMRLVLAFATKYRRYGLPQADLAQEGHVGLMEAAARFDPELDIRFSTYAAWWIRASMQDYVLRNWSIVRGGTSSAQKSLFFNLRRLRARLSHDTSDQTPMAAYQKIARTLGVPARDVAAMDARLSGSDVSLNAPVGDGDDGASERVQFLVDAAPLPDAAAEASLDDERKRDWLKNAMLLLSERERTIIERRRLAEEGATLESLGATLNISKERVRQIEQIAIGKLRDAMCADLRKGTPNTPSARPITSQSLDP